MKILITTDTFSPTINGVVISISNLYKQLKDNGYEVKILTLSNDGNQRVDGDVYYLKSMKIGIYPDARIYKGFINNKLIKKIIQWEPDLIHSQSEFSMMLLAKYISRKLNIPVIHTYHTMYEEYLDYLLGGKLITKNMSAKITKRMLNSLDSVISPTEKVRNLLLSYGVNKPIYVVPTGIDLKRFKQKVSFDEEQEIRLKLKIRPEDRVIAYIGRIAEEKNISEILTFLKGVFIHEKNIKLLIVGGGPYLNELVDQVNRENIQDNVIFTGMINSSEIHKYYKIAEIFVTASTSETQGLTYIEALASGCPIVCKYDSCIDGVIEQGKNGYTYRQESEFSDYIKRILNDVDLRNKMSNQAIIKANQYSSDIFSNKVLDKYYDIINSNKEKNMIFVKMFNPKS